MEEIRGGRPLSGSGPSEEYRRLTGLISTNPRLAWDDFVRFVAGGPPILDAQALLEDFVSLHGPEFIDAIESEADSSPTFAEIVAQAHVGDSGGPAADRFRQLQRKVRVQLGIDHWEGWVPFSPHDIDRTVGE